MYWSNSWVFLCFSPLWLFIAPKVGYGCWTIQKSSVGWLIWLPNHLPPCPPPPPTHTHSEKYQFWAPIHWRLSKYGLLLFWEMPPCLIFQHFQNVHSTPYTMYTVRVINAFFVITRELSKSDLWTKLSNLSWKLKFMMINSCLRAQTQFTVCKPSFTIINLGLWAKIQISLVFDQRTWAH